MKTCSVPPAGLGTTSFGAQKGLAEPWGAVDSDLWTEKPQEGSEKSESVPIRTFMATLQSTIPFIYCFLHLLGWASFFSFSELNSNIRKKSSWHPKHWACSRTLAGIYLLQEMPSCAGRLGYVGFSPHHQATYKLQSGSEIAGSHWNLRLVHGKWK